MAGNGGVDSALSVCNILHGQDSEWIATPSGLCAGLGWATLARAASVGSRRLPDKSLQVLTLLLEHPGKVVTREEMRRRLWPADVFVDFDNLNTIIARVRQGSEGSAGPPTAPLIRSAA
ncbi:MAG TPA: helix-turn-helix domain-containing protein [Terriglobales bacterium]|nr:helix-turn-helix domain-containing protein [Terriglobales bacterium]